MEDIKELSKQIATVQQMSEQVANINAGIAESIANIRKIPNSPEMQALLSEIRQSANMGKEIAANTKAIVDSIAASLPTLATHAE